MFDIFRIVDFLKKRFSKKDLFFILVLIVAYFLTRIINLTKFPIFSDEAIYIQWAKTAWHDASWRFISLTDGKQPLQTWGTIPLLKLFPNDALFAGRLFSVLTGLLSLTGIFVLLNYLFGKRAAFFGAFFYTFTPYFLFYDRMALVDSGVNSTFIWILFFSVLLIRTMRLDVAIIFGLFSGMSLLTKSTAQVFLALSILAPILVIGKNFKKSARTVINYLGLYLVVVSLAFALYNIQRLSPFLHFVAQKNTTFVMTFDEFFKNPFGSFFFNFRSIPYYVLIESGLVLPIVAIFGWFIMMKKDKKLFTYLTLWLFVPFIAICFFSKVLFPRYVIFFATLLLIFNVYFFVSEKNKGLLLTLLAVYILIASYFNYSIMFDYKLLPFPALDRGQYIEGGPAGIGAKEIIDYARERSKEKPVIILAEGNFGMSGDVLNVFIRKDEKIFVKGEWPLDKKQLIEQQKNLDSNYIFAVFPYKEIYPKDWPIKLIKKYEKPGNQTSLKLFELVR